MTEAPVHLYDYRVNVHPSESGWLRNTLCGVAAASESHITSHHEIKRGRVTCGECVVVYTEQTRKNTPEAQAERWRKRAKLWTERTQGRNKHV